jgi:hypothetical protein
LIRTNITIQIAIVLSLLRFAADTPRQKNNYDSASERMKQVYDTIKLESLRGGCTVLVLVAPDVDAIAACRIVTTALCAPI